MNAPLASPSPTASEATAPATGLEQHSSLLRPVLIALLMASVLVAVLSARQTAPLPDANFYNPDSYYKLVLLQDRKPDTGFQFVARDNWPEGNHMHWSLPHTVTVWALHQTIQRPLMAAGIAQRDTLILAGASVTALSLLLLFGFAALAIVRISSPGCALATGMTLTFAAPIHSYAYLTQITHHIFLLVPLAAAAACLFHRPGRQHPALDVAAGLLLALALWITPETMPFVTGLAAIRMAMRLQVPASATLWPLVVSLPAFAFLAWTIDPPPPTFHAWALDHLSLAHLLFAGLLASCLLVTEALSRSTLRWTTAAGIAAGYCLSTAAIWLWAVPEARGGPVGLIPEELRPLFWDRVQELQAVKGPAEALAFQGMPLMGGLLAAVAAYRLHTLWLLVVAVVAAAYGVLAGEHIRMGSAASLAGALAYGAGLACVPAMLNDRQVRPTGIAAAAGVAAIWFPIALYMLAATLYSSGNEKKGTSPRVHPCPLNPVAETLNTLPPATVLTPLFHGSALLYLTHHRTVAAPYHHNVTGMLDNFSIWRDPESAQAQTVIAHRQIRYVLFCTAQPHVLPQHLEGSLQSRLLAGAPPQGFRRLNWPSGVETPWQLYEIHPLEAATATGGAR